MTNLVSERLRTGTYTPPNVNPGEVETVLLFANEIASPLTGPGGEEGDFASFTKLVTSRGAPTFAACQHERLGSADTVYDPALADQLQPGQRQGTIRQQAEVVLETIASTYPAVQRIIGVGHSAGAAQIIDMARAIGEHSLLAKTDLGRTALSNIVAMDYPRYPASVVGGLLRFFTYAAYERCLLETPPKALEEQVTTPDAAKRTRVDGQYNIDAWSNGVQDNLEWVGAHMPDTAVYLAPARHSPNNILRPPGQLSRYVSRMNRLREGMAGAKPFQAEVYQGPHAGGSRHTVMIQLLRRAGVV